MKIKEKIREKICSLIRSHLKVDVDNRIWWQVHDGVDNKEIFWVRWQVCEFFLR